MQSLSEEITFDKLQQKIHGLKVKELTKADLQ